MKNLLYQFFIACFSLFLGACSDEISVTQRKLPT